MNAKAFDFDSLAPVQGEVFEYSKHKEQLFHFVLDYLIAIDVVLVGTWVAVWWVDGGFSLMTTFFIHHLPELIRMIQVGNFS